MKNILEIPLHKIKFGNNPRTKFDHKKIVELAKSIKENDLINPITVNHMQNHHYEIVTGERRYRAFLFLKKKSIPAIIVNQNKKQSFFSSLLENLQREDLNPVEEARGYKKLQKDFEMHNPAIAKKLGKPLRRIENCLAILNCQPEIIKAVEDNKITMSSAPLLSKINDDKKRHIILKKTINKKLSLTQLITLIKNQDNNAPKLITHHTLFTIPFIKSKIIISFERS